MFYLGLVVGGVVVAAGFYLYRKYEKKMAAEVAALKASVEREVKKIESKI